MSVRFGTDGTLYCNTVRYNYKQTRNLIVNCDAGLGSVGGIGWTRTNVDNKVVMPSNSFHAQYGMQFKNGSASTYQTIKFTNHMYYFQCMVNGYASSVHIYATGVGIQYDFLNTKNYNTGNNWVKVSEVFIGERAIYYLERLGFETAENSTNLYSTRWILIDLTEAFGSGNEPTKEWCDNNILEANQYVGYSNLGAQSITTTNYNTNWSGSQLTLVTTGYLNRYENSTNIPREYFYSLTSLAENAEGYLNSANNLNIAQTNSNQTIYYYTAWWTNAFPEEIDYNSNTNVREKTMDFYCPVAEPPFPPSPIIEANDFNGGGGMNRWKKQSFYATRTNWSSGSYPARIDLNNFRTSFVIYMCNIMMTSNSLVGKFDTEVNQEWFDRNYGGESLPIIRIKDHQNTKINFNKDYDIICNDIEIDTSATNISMDETGTIKCKKLVRVQNY